MEMTFDCSLLVKKRWQMWDVKEPAHYSRRVGHEVPGVVAVLCECMGGYSRSTLA